MTVSRNLVIILFIGALSAAVMIAAVSILVALYGLPADIRDRSPEQPIPFSHRLHAGDLEIHCLHCHRDAPVSRTAGVPSMETCMGCHRSIARDGAGVKALTAAFDRKEPIAWIKIHDVPDFVYFPHKAHVSAGLSCKRCHGPVRAMETVARVSSLTMGWCLGCHNKNRAGVDCWTCHV